MASQHEAETSIAAFFACKGGVMLESVQSDIGMVGQFARAELACRNAGQAEGFPVGRLDPESMASVAGATRELIVASLRMPVSRFDELVGEAGERIALRARRTAAGVDFDIAKLGEGAQPEAGWISLPTAATAAEVDAMADDVARTANESPFARMRHDRLQEERREEHAKVNAARAELGLAPLEFKAKAFPEGPRMSSAEARENARFVLARTWAMNHDEAVIDLAFKAAHGVSRAAAFKMAAEAAHEEAGAAEAPAAQGNRSSIGAPARKPAAAGMAR